MESSDKVPSFISRKPATFQSLKVNEWLLKQLNTMGIKAPSEIQQKAIPVIKSGTH